MVQNIADAEAVELRRNVERATELERKWDCGCGTGFIGTVSSGLGDFGAFMYRVGTVLLLLANTYRAGSGDSGR